MGTQWDMGEIDESCDAGAHANHLNLPIPMKHALPEHVGWLGPCCHCARIEGLHFTYEPAIINKCHQVCVCAVHWAEAPLTTGRKKQPGASMTPMLQLYSFQMNPLFFW